MLQRLPTRPLPGTEAPVRALFVDRWGTLLDASARCLERRWEGLAFTRGAVDALFRAQQAGWLVYLIGNEDGVARGRVTEAVWKKHEEELLAYLASQGVRVTRNYACLNHPNGRGAQRGPSVFLLPDTGALFHAAQMEGVELTQSWVIGDTTLELAAGERAGCKVAGVRTGLALTDRELDVEPHFIASDLAEVVGVLARAAVRAA